MTLLWAATATVFRASAGGARRQPAAAPPGLRRLDKDVLTAHAVPSHISGVGICIKVEVNIGGGRSGFANMIGYYAAFFHFVDGVYS